MVFNPVIATTGFPRTLMEVLGLEIHPVDELVNVKVALPFEIPVTVPEFEIVATVGLLLDQIPPVFGDSELVPPMHIFPDPIITGIGLLCTPILAIATAEHPTELVTVTL